MKTNKIFYVYHLIDPRNNLPFYIGKGKNKRMYNHEKETKRRIIPNNNPHLYYKIKQIINQKQSIIYSKILENIDEQTALLQEIIEIQCYGRENNRTGILCNLTDGGEGISGKIFSSQEKINIRKRMTGTGNPMYGKHHTQEVKKFISENNKGNKSKLDQSIPKNAKIKMLKTMQDTGQARKVYQFSKNGILIKEYNSLSDAAKNLNTSKGNIHSCIKKPWYSVKNFYFRLSKKFINHIIPKNGNSHKIIQINKNNNSIKIWNSGLEIKRHIKCLSYDMLMKYLHNNKPFIYKNLIFKNKI